MTTTIRRWLALLCIAACAPLQAMALGVGVTLMQTKGEYAVPLAVWYPSPTASTSWTLGPNRLNATRDAPVAPGLHGLIVLSHGSGGGEFGHSDLAEALAQAGYIVAAPRHLGDSYDQPQGRGTDVQIIGRPWQVVATLDTVLADPRFAAAIDARRIGMAGFSAGGYTTLVMAGARPAAAVHAAHCRAHPDDRDACGSGGAAKPFETRPGWTLPKDRRVRAAVAMAPLSVMFDAQGLAGVDIPLRIVKAANDEVVQNRYNADAVLRALPKPAEVSEVPGGHFVFLAPCTEQLKSLAPMICSDAPNVDRAAVHARLNAEIVAFFDRSLKR